MKDAVFHYKVWPGPLILNQILPPTRYELRFNEIEKKRGKHIS